MTIAGVLRAELQLDNRPLVKGVDATEATLRRFSLNSRRQFDQVGGFGAKAFNRLRMEGDRTARALQIGFRGVSSTLMNIARGGGIAGIIGGAGVGAALTTIQQTARGIATIGDEAQRAGVSIEAWGEWRHVAGQNRIAFDAMADALKELNIRGDEFATTLGGGGAEAFQRLGFTAEEVAEKLKNPSELLLEIIDRTRRLGDTAAATRIFDEIFGGSGAEQLVRLLGQSQDELRATIQQAHDLNLVLSDDLVDSAAELDRKFTAVATTVETGLKTSIVNAASALSDFISQFNSFMARWSGESGLGAGFGGNQPWSELLTPEQRDAMNLRLRLGNRAGENLYEGFGFGTDGNIVLQPPVTPATTPTKPSTSRAGSASAIDREQQALAKLLESLRLELDLLGATEAERRIRTETQRLGVDLASAEGQEIASLINQIDRQTLAQERLNSAMETAASLSSEVFRGLANDLMQGVTWTDALNNALGRLASRLMDMAIEAIVGGLVGSLFGGFGGGGMGLLGGLFGFERGGFTGHGGRMQPAGIVHRGEYVLSAPAVRRAGVARLDALHNSLKGYSTGGLVTDAMANLATPTMAERMGGLPAMASEIKVTNDINITLRDGEGREIPTRQSRRSDGGIDIDAIVAGALSRSAMSGKLGAFESIYGLRKRGA